MKLSGNSDLRIIRKNKGSSFFYRNLDIECELLKNSNLLKMLIY
jgi:hypothetical protein